MHLYVALTSRGRHAAYHWTLITSAGAPTGVVNAYQITADAAHAWRLAHDRLRLAELPRAGLVGCVCLSTAVAERTEHVDAFIREFPAEPGRYRTDGGAAWSSARWVLRCLESLVEAGILELEMRRVYQAVVARGAQLEAGKGGGAVVDGVSVVAL